LNEGFATWVGWLAVDHLYPEWDVWAKFTSESLQMALTMDSLRGSHPIEVEVKDALEIDQIFDAISYMKGSSCIRMLVSRIGYGKFIEGVCYYLKKHAYGNATTEDLWAALSEVSGRNVTDIMELWIKHVGYPVLTVEENWGEDAGGIKITQSRFISTGTTSSLPAHSGDATEEDQILWDIPLNLKAHGRIDNNHIQALEKQKSIFLRLARSFYKLNIGSQGVYRVNYPASRLEIYGEQILKGPDWRTLTGLKAAGPLWGAADRIGLVADAAALAISGEGSTTGFLALVENFKLEGNYFVWDEVLKRLTLLRSAWYEQPEEVMDALRAFSKALVTEKFAEIGWDARPGEDYLTSQFRPLLLKEAYFAHVPGYPPMRFSLKLV
jgi:aminopeptidase N